MNDLVIKQYKVLQLSARRKHSIEMIPICVSLRGTQSDLRDVLILFQSLRNGSIITFGIQVNLDPGLVWIVDAQQLHCGRHRVGWVRQATEELVLVLPLASQAS